MKPNLTLIPFIKLPKNARFPKLLISYKTNKKCSISQTTDIQNYQKMLDFPNY